jgi:hypothetical protein
LTGAPRKSLDAADVDGAILKLQQWATLVFRELAARGHSHVESADNREMTRH